MDKERDRRESCQGKEAGQACCSRKKTWLGCREETAGLARMIRINAHPINTDDNLIVDDRLEQEGSIRLFEYTGGALYPPSVLSEQPNAVIVAAAEITKNETGIKVKRLFREYGYDSLVELIVDQLLHFADYHGYGDVEFLDLNLFKLERCTDIMSAHRFLYVRLGRIYFRCFCKLPMMLYLI